MRKITLHIGSHKAGSTAIQETCKKNIGLLRQSGVVYPTGVFPNYPGQHSELAVLLHRPDHSELGALFDGLAATLDETGATHLFLSGEDLCSGTKPSEVLRLAKVLQARFDEIAIVLVLRRKADYVRSHYNHFLHHSERPVSVEDFQAAIKFSPRDTLKNWTDAFGAKAVSVFAYQTPEGAQPFLRRFFGAVLGVDLTEDILRANAGVNQYFDVVSASFVNDLLKPIPGVNMRDVSAAYAMVYGSKTGRLPMWERGLNRILDGTFPDADWQIDGVPDLIGQAKVTVPLNTGEAGEQLEALSEFLVALRTRFIDSAAAEEMPLRRSEAVIAYRAILGRAPSIEEMSVAMRGHKKLSDLRLTLLECPEFRNKSESLQTMAAPAAGPSAGGKPN